MGRWCSKSVLARLLWLHFENARIVPGPREACRVGAGERRLATEVARPEVLVDGKSQVAADTRSLSEGFDNSKHWMLAVTVLSGMSG